MKKRTILSSAYLFLCILITMSSAAAQNGPEAEPVKVQALIITGQNSAAHPWRDTTPELRAILEATGRFEVRVSEEFRGAAPETLRPYDVLILNYSNGGNEDLAWGTRSENAVEEFVRSGKGLVLYHASLSAFRNWAAFEEMSGGNYRPDNGHHSPAHDFAIDIVDPDHPVTRGLETALMAHNDELYANLRWRPEGTFHVLATAYDDHSLYAGRARQPIPGPGRDQPILWTTRYGEGRVFATAFGHGVENLRGQSFRVTFARGAEWAATGVVTQPVPSRVHAASQPDLEGIWGFDSSLFRQYSKPQYTAEGQRRVDNYDVSTDDPSYRCIPSGLGRAWDEPDTTAKIEQYDDRVVISYEMFDLVRTIELNRNGHPLQPEPSTANIDGVPMPTMGHSIGWYEDDTLVIETVGYAPGYITTLDRYPPQSEALRSIERIRRDEEDRLVVELAYADPIVFTAPLTSTNRYFRSDFPFTVYGCDPDNHTNGE